LLKAEISFILPGGRCFPG